MYTEVEGCTWWGRRLALIGFNFNPWFFYLSLNWRLTSVLSLSLLGFWEKSNLTLTTQVAIFSSFIFNISSPLSPQFLTSLWTCKDIAQVSEGGRADLYYFLIGYSLWFFCPLFHIRILRFFFFSAYPVSAFPHHCLHLWGPKNLWIPGILVKLHSQRSLKIFSLQGKPALLQNILQATLLSHLS